MSDPNPSSESEADPDDGHERSSGEELLEHEERVKEADRRERAARSAEAAPSAEEEAEDDARDVESEWHGWLLGLVVVAGIVLFLAPGFLVPELLGTLGAFLVAIGVFGFVLKWAIERSG